MGLILGTSNSFCLNGEKPMEEYVPLMSAEGIECIELRSVLPVRLEYFRSIAQSAAGTPNTRIYSIHVYGECKHWADNLSESLLTADITARIEGILIVLHPPHGDGAGLKDKRFIGALEKIIEHCGENKIRVALENMCPRVSSWDCAELLRLVGALDSPRLGICLDTNHIQPGEDLCGLVDLLGEKLFHIHASDYDGIDERHWFPGEGIIDWPPFIDMLARTGYGGVFMYEIRRLHRTVEEAIKEIKSNFTRLLS